MWLTKIKIKCQKKEGSKALFLSGQLCTMNQHSCDNIYIMILTNYTFNLDPFMLATY